MKFIFLFASLALASQAKAQAQPQTQAQATTWSYNCEAYVQSRQPLSPIIKGTDRKFLLAVEIPGEANVAGSRSMISLRYDDLGDMKVELDPQTFSKPTDFIVAAQIEVANGTVATTMIRKDGFFLGCSAGALYYSVSCREVKP